MRVRVDGELCTGHARCVILAEHVFELDDEGYCSSRGDEIRIPEGHEESARTAVENCPERAMSITED